MRPDVPLYIIAIICFALAGYLQCTYPEQFAYIITLTVLGVIFLGAGYSMKPKPIVIKTKEQLQVPETQEAEAAPKIESETKVAVTEEKAALELTHVKGIGPKRAEQLKSIGIQSVEELAKESSEELSKKAKVSTKVADKWIKAAKKALEEE